VTSDTVISLMTTAMELALKIAAPVLIVGLVVGVVISIFQAITQIQEQTLSFVPKIIASAAVLIIAGPWLLNELVTYTEELWRSIPDLIG
jgi:flagellar biosynthetic protein FliQ